MISVPSARRNGGGHKLFEKNAILHTNEIMAMVDKWKKEEARWISDCQSRQSGCQTRIGLYFFALRF